MQKRAIYNTAALQKVLYRNMCGAKSSRRHPGFRFEQTNKMIYIFIPDSAADLLHLQVCVQQQFFCLLNADEIEILQRGDGKGGVVFPAQAVAADSAERFLVSQGERKILQVVDIGVHIAQIGRDIFRRDWILREDGQANIR